MAPLTPPDVKRWDVEAIQSVFETASGRAGTLQHLGDNLGQVHDVLADWHGEAGEAFRADVGKARRDIEADRAESTRVAAAVSQAEADVRACKTELADIEQAADGYGWTITPDWQIDVGDTGIGIDPISFAAEQQALQDALDACKVHAHSADHELAAAIRGAVGDDAADASGAAPGAAPLAQGASPVPGGKPKTWHDMLLPAGPANGGPGGAPPAGGPAPIGTAGKPSPLEDSLMPAGGGGDRGGGPPSLEDLLMGRGQPSSPGDQQPRNLSDMLSRLGQPGLPGVPAPRLNPADVDRFKAMARQSMLADGVPPDQIEAQLDAAVARTQQWLDNGMPNYIPPAPQASPPPGFAEGFGDRWRATEQGIENLFGQGGPGAPGVLESWEGLSKGLGEIEQNPLGVAIGEVKEAIDSPSLPYYLGGKASDAVSALPGLMFGGEGAAVEAALPAETVTEGGAPLAVVRGWDPTGGMSWDDFASQFGTSGAWNYPLNDGFPPGYVPQPAQLPEGVIIDRFGSEYGRYLAPDGIPFADRALAPESVGGDYNRYMVTGKPLPPGWQIVEGPVQPFYGQTPSPDALQYMIVGPDGVDVTVKELLDRGILDDYGPRLGR